MSRLSLPLEIEAPGAQEQIELSVVRPCLNEAAMLETCIMKSQSTMHEASIVGEVVIADHGSTDGSQDLIRSSGARVIDVIEKGCGKATMRFMDWVGTAHNNIALPSGYLTNVRWSARSMRLKSALRTEWTTSGCIPFLFGWVFGRSPHFVAKLEFVEPS